MKVSHLCSLLICVNVWSCVIATSAREKSIISTSVGSSTTASSPIEHQRGERKLPPTKLIEKKSRGKTNLDRPNKFLSYTSLTELVKNRPHQSSSTLTREYLEAFSKHVDDLGIDVQQDETAVAKSLSRLQNLEQDRFWQDKFFRTIKQYLSEKKIDDHRVESILGYLHGRNSMKHDKLRKKRIAEDDGRREQRLQQSKDYYYAHKGQRYEKEATKERFIIDLDKLVKKYQYRPNAPEVARLAQTLQSVYPEASIFRSALRSYLQRNEYTPEEILLVFGAQSREGQRIRSERYRARQKAAQKETEASTSAPNKLEGAKAKVNEIDTLEKDPWWEDGYFDQ
jgi:hypothetical protein